MRLAGVCCAVLALAPAGQQPGAMPERIVAVRTGAVVTVETLAGDLAQADVLFVNGAAGGLTGRFAIAVVQAISGRRPQLVVALDAIDRAAQEPLEHFQMGHLSDAEFAAEARLSPAHVQAYMPFLTLAKSRLWPIVATGPAAGDDDEPMRAVVVQAAETAVADAKRPLVVSIHAGGLSAASLAAMRRQLSGQRVVVLTVAPVPAREIVALIPPAADGSDYVAYVR